VSLSFLTVFVPASSSITHPYLEGLVESKPICGCCFVKPIRTPAQADVTFDVVCSVLGPSRHIPSSPPFPETFEQITGLPALQPCLLQTCSPVQASTDITILQPTNQSQVHRLLGLASITTGKKLSHRVEASFGFNSGLVHYGRPVVP
jgi:hypothetical protein